MQRVILGLAVLLSLGSELAMAQMIPIRIGQGRYVYKNDEIISAKIYSGCMDLTKKQTAICLVKKNYYGVSQPHGIFDSANAYIALFPPKCDGDNDKIYFAKLWFLENDLASMAYAGALDVVIADRIFTTSFCPIN